MRNKENAYYLMFGIVLYIAVMTVSDIVSEIIFLLAAFVIREVSAAIAVAGALRLSGFAALAALSIVLLLRCLRPRPKEEPMRRPPTPLFIVLLSLLPVLYAGQSFMHLAWPFVLNQIPGMAPIREFYTASSAMTLAFTFLKICLLAALSIIVIVKSKQPESDKTTP